MKKKAAVKKALKYQDTFASVIHSQSVVVSENANRSHVTIEVGTAQMAGGVFTQLICIDPCNVDSLIDALEEVVAYRELRETEKSENDNS